MISLTIANQIISVAYIIGSFIISLPLLHFYTRKDGTLRKILLLLLSSWMVHYVLVGIVLGAAGFFQGKLMSDATLRITVACIVMVECASLLWLSFYIRRFYGQSNN